MPISADDRVGVWYTPTDERRFSVGRCALSTSLPQVPIVVGSCFKQFKNSRNPCNACLTQPCFGAEMCPPNQRSKPIFRKNAEHYVAYNALHVIYRDIISLQHIQAKMQICVISEQSAII